MLRLSRRSRAIVLLPAGILATGGSIAVWNASGSPALGSILEDPTTGASILSPALLVVGVILLAAAAVAIAGRSMTPWSAAAIPVVSAIGVSGFGIRAGLIAATSPIPEVTPAGTFVLTTAITGTAIAPIVIATIRQHTPVLLIGSVVLLASIFLSPAPGFTVLSGLTGGVIAVGTLWLLDAESWRP